MVHTGRHRIFTLSKQFESCLESVLLPAPGFRLWLPLTPPCTTKFSYKNTPTHLLSTHKGDYLCQLHNWTSDRVSSH